MANIQKEKAIIKEQINDSTFIAVLENGHEMEVTIAGKMNAIKKIILNEGDQVWVEYSPFDLSRGIIPRNAIFSNKESTRLT